MKTNVSFVKTPEEIEQWAKLDHLEFYRQEKIQAWWLFSDEVYKKILPPGLEPAFPMAIAYVSYFGRPQHLYPYTEGALFVLAKNNGETGCYCLSMPLDGNDQAQDGGREKFGYPKKAARVKLARRGDKIEGWIERNDVRFFEISGEIGEYNDKELGAQLIGNEGAREFRDCVFLLDYNLNIITDNPYGALLDPNTYFQDIKLVKQTNLVNVFSQEPAKIEIVLRESEDDPWAELKPVKVLGGAYMRYETRMYGAEIRKRYETPEEKKTVLPYLFARWDSHSFGAYHASYKSSNFYR